MLSLFHGKQSQPQRQLFFFENRNKLPKQGDCTNKSIVVFMLFPFLLHLTKFVLLFCLQGLWDLGPQEATLAQGKLKHVFFTSSLRLFVLDS